jgi:hypothetical protein
VELPPRTKTLSTQNKGMAKYVDMKEDPNDKMGIHVEDLEKPTPPNLFLFPRNIIKMHREGDLMPFLPAYPPQLLMNLQPNPIVESCAGKFFLSATMGEFIFFFLFSS